MPAAGEQVTVAAPADWRLVVVRVVQAGEEEPVDGTAQAWTRASVYVAWKDEQGLQHRDWFAASDVTPAS